jgi:serine/threonine-protein kinase HipA
MKNLSFIVQANTITLAPHYDLLATGVYHTGSFAGADGRWPDVEMTIRLAGHVTRFGGIAPEAVLAAATTLSVLPTVAVRVACEVVTRTFRYFDRVYAEHYP